ncbi:MAG: NUDIX hydrolase [Spirochaetaceae bacterium]|nr:NUDIX hydrolase [Spirochaetaceae bacterium]
MTGQETGSGDRGSPVRPWRRVAGEMAFEHPLFKVECQEIAAGEDRRDVVAIHTGNWVNVIPIRDDGQVVLIRQWRFGIAAPTLEIPGGVVDPGESPHEAAQRELLEETGYRAARWTPLGAVHPNPAFMSNECSMFLAEGLEWVETPRGDGDEEIDVDSAPLASIPDLIRDGRISHSLVIVAFHLLSLRGGES